MGKLSIRQFVSPTSLNGLHIWIVLLNVWNSATGFSRAGYSLRRGIWGNFNLIRSATNLCSSSLETFHEIWINSLPNILSWRANTKAMQLFFSSQPSHPHHLFHHDLNRRHRHQDLLKSWAISWVCIQSSSHEVKQISTDYHKTPLATQEINGEHKHSSSSAAAQDSARCLPGGTTAPVPRFLGLKKPWKTR